MDSSTFYIGTHHASARWFAAGIPLFVSVRVLRPRRRLPRASAPWVLDSGGFTELSEYGRWLTPESEYVGDVQRLAAIGQLAWVAPQDWMCEPELIAKTGLSVDIHQGRTVESVVSLRASLGSIVAPVLQGYGPRDYDRCVERYRDAGIDLAAEPIVGLGSVCRRSRTREAVRLVRYLSDHGLRLHGFGIKGSAFRALRSELTSADSMAWSFAARYEGRNRNSIEEALRWRDHLLAV